MPSRRVALHVLVFFPRGGSAQVVRYLTRALAGTPSGWTARVVAGSIGQPGDTTHAPTFFRGDAGLVTVPYDLVAAGPPMHPSYEDRPGAPDRVFAALDDVTYLRHVDAWTTVLGAPGVLDGVAVAHLHHLTPAHEAVIRVAPRLPIVTHLHGTELLMLEAIAAGATWAHSASWVRRMRRWAGLSARVLVPSAATGERACDLLGLDPQCIAVVPNGVDPEVFDGARARGAVRADRWRGWLCDDPRGWTPEEPRAGAVRYTPRQLEPLTAPDAVVVLFVGRFTAVKRLGLLVRAHARARVALGRSLPLVIWGGATGEWEGEHPAHAIAASPWGGEVFLAGWRGHHQLAGALAVADILAVPSVAESFGLVYVEAMAMEVPPIACDAGGPPTFIDADPASAVRSGWLIPPDDEPALVDALVAAVRDEPERALRGRNGRAMVVGHLTWPAIAADVAAIYDAIAGPSTKAGPLAA